MGTSPSLIFRQVLLDLERGTPLTTRSLSERGIPAKQAARLAEAGWLQRIGQGVYLLPGDKLDRDASLAALAQAVPGLHVAGKTALAWRGVRHDLGNGPAMTLWGDKPIKLPAWFADVFSARYQASHLFDAGMPTALGLAPLPAGRSDVMVSTMERAMLELLSDVGQRQGLEEARNLIEAIRTPRMPVLEQLFWHLTRIKVVRLAADLAEELDLPWKGLALSHSQRLGGGRRWVSTTKTGERLDLRRPK
jgi:hypothetical protein